MSKIVIFGVGEIAEVVTYFLHQSTKYEVCAYTVDKQYIKAPQFKGKPVVDWESIEMQYPPDSYKLFCPISFKKLNALRKSKYFEGKAKGYSFISYIHPSALISTEDIGENCLILEGCNIQPFASIGNNVILWSYTHIGHHSVIGSHCFIAGCGGIGGSTIIGDECFIGGHFAIGDNLIVGERSLLGIGVTIANSVPSGAYVGSPKMIFRQDMADKLGKRL